MGLEARCVARCGELVGEGTASLELDRLLFRGPFRLSLRLQELTEVSAAGGELRLVSPGGTTILELGSRAPRWAERILKPPGRLEKLGIRAGQTAALVAVTDAELPMELVGADVSVVTEAEVARADWLCFQADSPVALERISALASQLPPKSAIWVIYPRGRKDLQDVQVFAVLRPAGWTDTRVARFSDTHTASKFVRKAARG